MSTDCCTYECNHGRDCPVRQTASHFTCAELGVCNSKPDCGCKELPEPTRLTEAQDEPLSPWEAIFLYGSIGACGVITILVIAGSLGWLYGTLAG